MGPSPPLLQLKLPVSWFQLKASSIEIEAITVQETQLLFASIRNPPMAGQFRFYKNKSKAQAQVYLTSLLRIIEDKNVCAYGVTTPKNAVNSFKKRFARAWEKNVCNTTVHDL